MTIVEFHSKACLEMNEMCNVFDKSCSLNSMFYNKKANFRPWKLAMETKISRFLTASNQKVCKGIKKSFEDVVHLDLKVYEISPALGNIQILRNQEG